MRRGREPSTATSVLSQPQMFLPALPMPLLLAHMPMASKPSRSVASLLLAPADTKTTAASPQPLAPQGLQEGDANSFLETPSTACVDIVPAHHGLDSGAARAQDT